MTASPQKARWDLDSTSSVLRQLIRNHVGEPAPSHESETNGEAPMTLLGRILGLSPESQALEGTPEEVDARGCGQHTTRS